jgi:hypothetical protein
MSSVLLTSRPMSLVRIEFGELYARHLCRHSQFGINVAHLVALFGVWFGVYGLVYWQTVHLCRYWQLAFPPQWVPVVLAVAYLAVLAPNIPLRVSVATALLLALFLAALFWLPELPFWVYLLMVPVCYKLQSWTHKVWSIGTDMTEFNRKYTKGFVLFVVLLFYEVPLLLNYLGSDSRNWRA